MFYLLYGNDIGKARSKFHSLVASLRAKRPEVGVYPLEASSVSLGALEELVVAQSLFDKKYLVPCDRVLAVPEVCDWVSKNLAELKESPHIFIFLEEKVSAALLKRVSKFADKVQEYPLAETRATKGADYNIFALTDALGARDRKRLWVLYQEALQRDLAPEEIFWKLVWQIKNLLLVSSSKQPPALGLKPFMFNKLTSQVRNFSRAELQDLSHHLVTMYHDARRGLVEFDIALEQLILSI